MTTESNLNSSEDTQESDFIYNIKEIVPVRKLARLFGVTVNALYQEKEYGRFGEKEFTELTVGEAIQIYRQNMLRSVELKRERMQAELKIKEDAEKHRQKMRESKGVTSDAGLGLQEKSIEQRIRLDRAKEMQTWLSIAEERGSLLVKENLLALYTPLFYLIKNGLIALASDYPETRERVDVILNDWYRIGQRMLEQSDKDTDEFVTEMMQKSLDDSMVELMFVPENRE